MKKNRMLPLLMLLCMMGCAGAAGEKEEPEQKTENANEQVQEACTEEEMETESVSSVTASEEKAERILCWGDSLTYGQGGNGVTYPSVLEEKLNLEVLNYGIQGETARQIGIRMGAFPMSVGACSVPAETTPVQVTLWQAGEDPIMMRLGDCAINPCYIGGIEGTLSYRAEENAYYFVRTEAGDAVSVGEGTEVETYASRNKKESDIIVLFAGTNLPPDRHTVGDLIEREKQMLEYLGSERYIVIGLTSKKLIPDVEEINVALQEAFGEHFLDIRSFLLEYDLKDAGIEPSAKDKKNVARGEIPASLRVDEVHGNEVFYRLIGERVYEKLEELSYITEEDKK